MPVKHKKYALHIGGAGLEDPVKGEVGHPFNRVAGREGQRIRRIWS